MKNKYIYLLTFFIILSVFLNFYKQNSVPGCLNADEAAFGYNAFSILKTGRDEHGAFLPLRLASFNDFKLPLYSYFSIPFIGIFGLNELSVRILNKILGILLVPIVFALSQELFGKKKLSLIAAFFTSTTLWIYILTRHAHEAVLCAFLILLSLLAFIKWEKQKKLYVLLLSYIFLFLSTFSYHSGRIFLLTLIIYYGYSIYKNTSFTKKVGNKLLLLSASLFSIIIPFVTDIAYGVNRVGNLLFFQTQGFHMRLTEYLGEHPNRIIHNKGIEALKDITYRYVSQLSTDFFLIHGDKNLRFGYEYMAPTTVVLFTAMIIGVYYLFKNQHKYRWLLLLLFLVSPLGNALTWQNDSLTRTYFIIFPIIIIASYGMYNIFNAKPLQNLMKFCLCATFLAHLFFLTLSWDIYFNHYFKRGFVIREWQCGYKEVCQNIKNDYDNIDTFYITERYGQPYIFVLFYLGYDPSKYHEETSYASPDEYGFSRVTTFNKFVFSMPKSGDIPKRTGIVAFPDELNGRDIDQGSIKRITYGAEEVFWYYKE